jgi:hypothetical protein
MNMNYPISEVSEEEINDSMPNNSLLKYITPAATDYVTPGRLAFL